MVFGKVKKAFKRKQLPMSERMIRDAEKAAAAEQKKKDERAIKRAYEQARQEANIAQARAKGKASAVPLSQRIGQGLGAMAGPPPRGQGKSRAKKAVTGNGILEMLTGPPPKAPPKPKTKTKKSAAIKINVDGKVITVHTKAKKKTKQAQPPRPPGLEDMLRGGGLF